MPRPSATALIVLLTVMLTLSSTAHADATATQISSAAQLLPGSTAQGVIGDYLLANGFVRVVIDDIPNAHGFANTGGNILDAATATGEDRFASLFTMFDNRFGRQANYTAISIINAGGGINTAQIRVIGVDSSDPNVAISTDYFLGPNDRFVRLTTTLTNNGPNAIDQLQVGDAIQWGLTEHFAPGQLNTNRNVLGDGYDIGGLTFNQPWVAGNGQGSSYGATISSGNMEVSNGSTWTDVNTTYLTLAAGGGSGSYTRYFIIGDGSISSVSDLAFAIRATTIGTLSGTVTENVTINPIADVSIVITTSACLGSSGARSYTVARTNGSGSYSANLQPGTYFLTFQAVGRSTPTCSSVLITASSTTTFDQVLSRQGTLSWDVRDASNAPIPAKISLLFDPLTSDREGPKLGDNRSLIGGYSILSATGAGSTAVAPGTYQVWISRGTEYEPVIQSLTLTEAATTALSATLVRVVDTTGYLSTDMHVHGASSADSAIGWDDRARQAAAEGLEIVIPTDHDYHSDMTAAIASTALGDWVGSMPGNEVTTNLWGHFNAYPVTVNNALPRAGALDHAALSPAQIFSALRSDPKQSVVQINHPRAGGLGYFDLIALNAESGQSANADYSADYDAVEVFNGKRLYQVPQVRNDWYKLLNTGKKLTGVGNTDTHQIFSQELGYPRNYLRVGTDTPSGLTEATLGDAVKRGEGLFTNGPFVEAWVNGQPIGSTTTIQGGVANLRIKVQAPAFMTVDTVRILVNGDLAQSIALSPTTGIVARLDQTYPIAVNRDSWIAVEVTGGNCTVDASNVCIVAGCPGRLDPIIPPLFGTDPVCPYAHTNPIYVDFDADGSFTGPGNLGVRVEPIAAIRPVDNSTYVNSREGEVVTIRGVVTSGSYALDHRNNLVYLSDSSLDLGNRLSGGAALFQQSLISPILQEGDEVQATGTIDNFNALLELTGVSVDILRTDAAIPDPLPLTIAQITNTANNEQWEGMLVRLSNVTITGGSWPSFGTNANLTINDGSGSMTMRIDSDTDIDGGPQPVGAFDLVAVLSQFDSSQPYDGGEQVLPRRRSDIIESGDPLRILHRPAADPVASCEATIRWYTSKAGDSVVEYGTTPSYGSLASDGALKTAHGLLLTSLQPNTLYHYRVTSGGFSSSDSTFTTSGSSTPILLTGPRVHQLSPSSVQITWTTDVSGTSTVRFGPSAAYGSTVSGNSGSRFHYATLTGLVPHATYHFQVETVSLACGGGSVISGDAVFDTLMPAGVPPEVSAPGAIVPFTLTKLGGSIQFDFEWLSGVTYHIYGATNETAIDAGSWDLKLCDLDSNALGTFLTNSSSFAQFTLTDGSLLPSGNLVVVAEAGGNEGSYGTKSDGALRTRDADGSAPTQLGCIAPCAPVSATITSVTPSTTVSLGTPQTFNGSGAGEGSLVYDWDFDYDGTSFTVDATGASANHTYLAAGSYTAALRVTDSCTNPAPQTAIDTEAITINAGSCGGLAVISQVYGGGGNSGATYRNDFIELFNRGDAPVSLAGWSVQYASSTGGSWQVTNLSGTLQPGQYYLVQQAAGAGGTTDLPTPDATGSIAMSGSTGKVALSNSGVALSGSCPLGPAVVDFVGYGPGANCSETAPTTPNLTNTTSASRNSGGCMDTGNNSTDFTNGSVNPRNSAVATNQCACP
jgi:hypothetical protein